MSALLVLAFAAPAHAVPRALARSAGVLAIAPGGDQVLVAQTRGANLRVVSIPLAGGAARQVFSFDVPSGLVPVSASLSASAQRAALILEMGPGPGQPEAVQTFAGPLAGGWVTLQPFTRTSNPGAVSPVRQQADGDRLFTTESRGEDTRVVVRDPAPHEVAFAEGEAEHVARFAGDFVATYVGGEQERSRLVVRDWRTGVVTTSAEVPDSFQFIALRNDDALPRRLRNDGTISLHSNQFFGEAEELQELNHTTRRGKCLRFPVDTNLNGHDAVDGSTHRTPGFAIDSES